MKREGKPSEKAILTSRVIDRPIRPLFPHDLRNDVSVVATVMSVEQDNAPELGSIQCVHDSLDYLAAEVGGRF